MNILPFLTLFPEQAENEIRVITLQNYPGIPDGEYGLIESYCTDFTCDCQRVMLSVLSKKMPSVGMLASISYGFDRNAKMAGPFLDPLNPQSQYSHDFLELVKEILETDKPYVDRLRSHYDQVKHTIANPPAAMRPLLAKLEISTPGKPRRTTRSAKSPRIKRAKTAGVQKHKMHRKRK